MNIEFSSVAEKDLRDGSKKNKKERPEECLWKKNKKKSDRLEDDESIYKCARQLLALAY